MQPIKILAGVTNDNELYFLEIEPNNRNNELSMSGFTVSPIRKSDAEAQVEENLIEGEEWKMAVEADQTTLGKDEWVQHVIDTDGTLAGFDNSLFDDELDIDGTEYIFDSRSCGQHTEDTLAKYFIDQTLYNDLMALWKTNHLKPSHNLTTDQLVIVTQAEKVANDQNITELATEAVNFINNND